MTNNDKWDELKKKIDMIDPWDCGAGQVAGALQDLVEYMDELMFPDKHSEIMLCSDCIHTHEQPFFHPLVYCRGLIRTRKIECEHYHKREEV